LTRNYVRFGKTKILYDIVKTSKKKTEILVIGKNSVKVLVPENRPDHDIRNIVTSNSRWIFQKQLNFDARKPGKLTYSEGSKLPYLGKEYKIVFSPAHRTGHLFNLENGMFFVGMADAKPAKIKFYYERWLMNEAVEILEKKVRHYCKLLHLDSRELQLKVKRQKHRLGSLGRNLNLNFNYKILMLPSDVIDYVVLHEICHIYVPNHSSKYWQLVGSVMPDYKNKKEWLFRNNKLLVHN
jgi:predicted metal-dependent hydrolase